MCTNEFLCKHQKHDSSCWNVIHALPRVFCLFPLPVDHHPPRPPLSQHPTCSEPFLLAVILSASTAVISSTINVHALVLRSALAEVQLPAGFTHSTDMNHFQQLFAVVP